MPLLRNKQGGFVTVGERAAKNLIASGVFVEADEYVDVERDVSVKPAQSHADQKQTGAEGDDTRDAGSDAQEPSEGQEEAKDDKPDVSVVRAWAEENDIPVSKKGRVSADVYEKYAEAHKN